MLASALVIALHGAKTHAVRHRVKPAPITVSINAAPLWIEPAPRYVHDRLLVPVRRILGALGLPFNRVGRRITTQVSDRTIYLTVGSKIASVNGAPVVLESAPVELKGVLFAPLRFFSAGLGAQAVYNAKTQNVEITSSLAGRSATLSAGADGTHDYKGIVEAVDNDSQPPTITVTSGASVKTIAIPFSASVIIDDVVANATTPGTLQDVHVGDYAKIELRKDNSVNRVVDAFASRQGTIAAISGNTLVLSDGHVIVPTGVTTLSLNGQGAKTGDLHIDDDLTVRYNLVTSEIREVVATRKAAGTPAPVGAVAIASIEPSLRHPLRPGETFEVLMKGTPGGQASYDVGPYFRGIALREASPGVYAATYKIPRGANFAAAPLFGYLRVRDSDAPRAQSTIEVSASSTPPGIGDFGPDQGQTVNNPDPSIYATFASAAVPVNVSSITLIINGHDVTASSNRSAAFIEYHPLNTFGDGPVHVTVRVADLAGNVATKSWTFTVKTH
ncbi:MAG: copper amine oxidase N-terminal domain-containing protein [Candidatus Eremiobacteraeota bacterium]|nr:copper amine oxidase N-terminal domain-containing protein [Candidatus Eremiobacteraeota bacterium]